MAAPKAPLLGASAKKDVTLEESVFAADIKPHVVHETVRAELNAGRQGTRAAKSRGLVAGGRAKPWRQKGTGRARAGTTRAPHWTGGGVAFPPTPRDFSVKVNRKARRSALRAVLSEHATNGSDLNGQIAVLDYETRPRRADKVFLRYRRARSFDEQCKHSHGPLAERRRLGAVQEQTCVEVNAKRAERQHCARW